MAARSITEDMQRRIQRAIVVPGASCRSVAKLLGISTSVVQRYSNPPYFVRPTPQENDAEIPELPPQAKPERYNPYQLIYNDRRRKKAPSDGESKSPPGEPGQNGAAGT